MTASVVIAQAIKDSRQWGDEDISAVEVLQALGRNGYAVLSQARVERFQAEVDRLRLDRDEWRTKAFGDDR